MLSHYFPISLQLFLVIDVFSKGNFGSSYYLWLCILHALHAMNYQISSILPFLLQLFLPTLPPQPHCHHQSAPICPAVCCMPAATLHFPKQSRDRSIRQRRLSISSELSTVVMPLLPAHVPPEKLLCRNRVKWKHHNQ